jgi:GTP-dependent phosphoenolpyruvate carboxykinase
MTTRLSPLSDWVAEVADLVQPDNLHWCTGTDEE